MQSLGGGLAGKGGGSCSPLGVALQVEEGVHAVPWGQPYRQRRGVMQSLGGSITGRGGV